ncbi:phosphatidylethanolamine binding protein [Polychytrium aggregatum]|uniref:phosphatidylethanolamine binding protein n=1 Tax=Polychytrium aggregatum TaxID=110093 RepID=UPI0022FDF5A0|nr:phosphatidylethanolamine binding protein [Polychytrium aggregatum]KAI9204455.1 phosphatidylethanolamine binding protein [Polychytrium aggregatum]
MIQSPANERELVKARAALMKGLKSLTDSDIIGEVVPSDFIPSVELNVKYLTKKVNYGKELSVDATRMIPEVSWVPETDKTRYTLIMTDPDVPSKKNPEDGEFRHWVVANIKGSAYKNGEDLSDYVSPSPPSGSGFHRYVFLLYKQPGKLDFEVLTGKRSGWEAHSWAEGYGLELVGCNFFKAQVKG